MNKKILLGVLATFAVTGGVLVYCVNAKEYPIVTLSSQKKEIDSELAIKSMDNVRNFEGALWLKDGRILGVKDEVSQMGEESKNSIPKLCIYNPEDKSFEELARANENEWIGVETISENKKYVFYSVLLKGDLTQNQYDYYRLNLETKSIKKLVHKMTATSRMVEDKQFIAAGMKIYQYDRQGKISEVILPKKLVDALSDFKSFTFQKYLDTYYKGKKIEGKTLKLLESNYKSDKENNAIIMLSQLGNELYLQSHAASYFIYDTIKGTYRIESTEDREKFFPELYLNEQSNLSKPSKNLKRECVDKDNEELWKIDDVGNKIKLIAKGKFITNHIQVSPDNSKLVFYLIDSLSKSQERNAYIYDFHKDKKIKIFPEIQGEPIWNESSKQFFMSSTKIDEDKNRYDVTSIVNLND